MSNMDNKQNLLLIRDAIIALPNYVFIKDKNLIYVACNENAAKLLGFNSSEDIIGKTDAELPWEKKFMASTQRYDHEVLQTNSAKNDIGEVINLANGQALEAVTERKPFYDAENNLVGVIVIYTASSKRNLADQTFFEHILKSLPYYIFWKNKDSVYLGANDNFAQLVGKTSKDIVGLTDFDLGWGAGEAEFFREADQKVMREKEQVNLEEYLKRPDGSQIVMLVSKVPVRNQEGDTIGMLGISVDITPIKQVEAELKVAKERAEIANQAKSDFIASMSHDLRTPLNAILGFAEILKLKNHYPEQLPLIESVTSAGKNLLGLIEDILSFSKIEAGKLELHSEPFDMLQLMEEVIGMVAHQANKKHLKLIVSYAENTPRYLISDPLAIRRILINLLSNSIKFTDEGHVIVSIDVVETNNKEVVLQIIVEDTGIGIAKDKLEIIFDRFARVELSYKSKYEGVGLGLSIVKQLAIALGGDVRANSKLGKGSTFYCTLPFKLQKLNKYLSSQKHILFNLHVLIIDDYPSRAKVISKQLNANCVISNSSQALKKLINAKKENNPFQIAIIDDEISHESPYELAKLIKQQGDLDIMLILFSRPISLQQTDQFIETGFEKIFIKPTQPTDIINRLSDAWNKWLAKKTPQDTIKKFQNIHVLLVEDDRLSQIVCKTFLENLGCTVDITDSGINAVELAKNNYDIIFMDIGLKDIDGLDVTKKIRSQNHESKDVPIIALTAHASKADEEKTIVAGMNGFLTKPVSYDGVKEALIKNLYTNKLDS